MHVATSCASFPYRANGSEGKSPAVFSVARTGFPVNLAREGKSHHTKQCGSPLYF